MFEPNSKSGGDDAKLASKAAQEANRATPAFSQSLHERIMRSVETARHAPIVSRQSKRAWWLEMSLIPAALAATITLAVSPLPGRLFFATRSAVEIPTPSRAVGMGSAAPDHPVLAIDQAAYDMKARVKDVIQTAMVAPQWGGLDHDVRLATQFFVDQVPLRSAWDDRDSNR